MLVEACEYRANFLHLRPQQAVILGIEHDHFDCYDTLADVERAFRQFAARVPPDGLILARHDCPVTRRVTAGLQCRVETFGFDPAADWSAQPIVGAAWRTRQTLRTAVHCRPWQWPSRPQYHCPCPPPTSRSSIAAAICWTCNSRCPAGTMCSTPWRPRPWRGTTGVGRADRRRAGLVPRAAPAAGAAGHVAGRDADRRLRPPPHRSGGSLETVRQMYPGRRVWCVFQPHQASRTARLLDELAASLHNADRVVVAEIFRAREGPFRSRGGHGGRPGPARAASRRGRGRPSARRNRPALKTGWPRATYWSRWGRRHRKDLRQSPGRFAV